MDRQLSPVNANRGQLSRIRNGVERRAPLVRRPRQRSSAGRVGGEESCFSRDRRTPDTESTTEKTRLTHVGGGEQMPESVTTILPPPVGTISNLTNDGSTSSRRPVQYVRLVPVNAPLGQRLARHDYDSGILSMPSTTSTWNSPAGSEVVFAVVDFDGVVQSPSPIPSPGSVTSNDSSFESQSTQWARLNSVDEFGSNRASTVELDEEDGAVCVDEHARRVKRWSTDSSSNGTTTVFSGGTSAGRSAILPAQLRRINRSVFPRPHSAATRRIRRELSLSRRAYTAPITGRRRVTVDDDVYSRRPPTPPLSPLAPHLRASAPVRRRNFMEDGERGSDEVAGAGAGSHPPLTRQHALSSDLIDFSTLSRDARARLVFSKSDPLSNEGNSAAGASSHDEGIGSSVGEDHERAASSAQENPTAQTEALRPENTDGFLRNLAYRPDESSREESGPRLAQGEPVAAGGSEADPTHDGGRDVAEPERRAPVYIRTAMEDGTPIVVIQTSSGAPDEAAILKSVTRAMSEFSAKAAGSKPPTRHMHPYDSFEHLEDSFDESEDHEAVNDNAAASVGYGGRRYLPQGCHEDNGAGLSRHEGRSVSRSRRLSEPGSNAAAAALGRCGGGEQHGDQLTRERRHEPVRGLEVLDLVTRIELKRVGEEDETKEVADLHSLGLLHNSSSQLRDKFSYKITFNAKGLPPPLPSPFKCNNRHHGEGLSVADEDGYHGNDVDLGDGQSVFHDEELDESTNGAQQHKALFYVTRKLRCISAVSLGHCTTGYRMRVLDRAGRAVLEVHKPCHFTPPFVRNVLLPVCTEAEVFLVNHQKQGEGMTRPPVVLLGKIKRRWSGGFLPRFTLHGVDGSAFATFKASRSKGFKIKFNQGNINEGGQLCTGSDVEDICSRIVLAYPADLRLKPLLLGAAVYLSHYYRVGINEAFGWMSCFCDTFSL